MRPDSRAAYSRPARRQLILPFRRAELRHAETRRKRRTFRLLRETPAPTAEILQMRLPLHLPRYQLSKLAIAVLAIVSRLAETHQEMPGYPTLAEMVGGGHGRQAVAKAFDRLVNLDFCRVEYRPRQRRVLILRTGRLTDWGQFISGPVPFSRADADLFDAAPPSPEAPLSPPPSPSRSQVVTRLPAPRREIRDVPSARCCQFPLDLEARGEKVRFCEQPSVAGKSWCAEHMAVVYRSHANVR